MYTLSERPFHLLMGVLLFGSLLLDPLMRSLLPTWQPPEVGLLTLVIGLVWVALFAGYRMRNVADRQRVLEDRLQRAERRIDVLDAEASERRRPLI